MKEFIINKDLQQVEKVFWICEAKEDILKGIRQLTMTVTDGDIQRRALWENTDARVEDMVGTFKTISGTILHGDLLIVSDVSETHYAKIDIDKFFNETQVPVSVMYEHMDDLSATLPPLISVPCASMVHKFQRFTNRQPVTAPDYEARICATEEAFNTVVKWQKILQYHNDIDDSELIMAGVIIGSFMSFFESELLLPDWCLIPAEILSCNLDYIAKEIKLEKDVTEKIKKVIYALYYTKETEFEDAVISNEFFKQS